MTLTLTPEEMQILCLIMQNGWMDGEFREWFATLEEQRTADRVVRKFDQFFMDMPMPVKLDKTKKLAITVPSSGFP
jgi:hypothetical protein